MQAPVPNPIVFVHRSVQTADGVTWSLDTDEEFLAEYQQDIPSASYSMSNTFGSSLNYTFDRSSAQVHVQLPERRTIENVFRTFEAAAPNSLIPAPPEPLPAPPRPVFRRSAEWSRWTGSYSSLVEAIRMTVHDLGEWYDTQPASTVEFGLRSGLTIFLQTVDDLDSVMAQDIRQIRSVLIRARIPGHDDVAGVTIALSDSVQPAAAVQVIGDDRDRVDGLSGRLRGLLNSISPGIEPGLRGLRISAVVLFAAGAAMPLLLGIGLFSVFGLTIVAGAGLAAMSFGLAWLFPQLELLPGVADSSSRWIRFRVQAVALLVAIVGAVVGGAIYVALHLPK